MNRRKVATVARVVIIKSPSGFVLNIDPLTREATKDAQQFSFVAGTLAGGTLSILPREQWVDSPEILEVGSVRLG
jgi:hypothetical protein